MMSRWSMKKLAVTFKVAASFYIRLSVSRSACQSAPREPARRPG